MDTNSFLTVSQLSNELDSSEVIIKFLVKKFKQLVPATSHQGQSLYNHDSIITLIFLLDEINRGVLPSTIEKEFKNKSTKVATPSENSITKKTISFQEQTVRALEKRAEAEEKKVLAMNNIATAINQFKASFLNNSETQQNNQPHKSEEFSHPFVPEEPEAIIHNAIDDLSMLIDIKPSAENLADKNPLLKIDDLSSLLDKKLLKNPVIDDLSILIQGQESNIVAIDDLSALIPKDKDSGKKLIIQKPESSPEDDFEKYKSEIINIIINLKEQGLTEKETCEQFNLEGILTFAGKTKWSVKTISQIYQLIENAA